MNIPDSATLRKAIAIATKIEGLQEELRQLLAMGNIKNATNKDSLASGTADVRRYSHSLKSDASDTTIKKESKKKISFSNINIPARSSLKGRPRATSPSGPLGAAVLKILEEHGEAMKVTEIFEALANKNYQWTARNPLQTLYIRMPKLGGIVRVENGKYRLSGVPFVPAKRGRKAKSSLALLAQASSVD